MGKRFLKLAILLVAVIAVAFTVIYIKKRKTAKPDAEIGKVKDEALVANRTVDSLLTHIADEDYFHDMDGGISLTADEIKGRNMWIVWTGGNDRFWDTISKRSVGTLDLFKTLSSYDPEKDTRLSAEVKAKLKGVYKFSRDNR